MLLISVAEENRWDLLNRGLSDAVFEEEEACE